MSREVRSILARILAVWALAVLLPCASGSPPSGPGRLARHVHRLNTQRNGLLQQIIYCLERDHLGRIWAGTRQGPFVYDGRRWTPLPLPELAASRSVRAILEDAGGALWFATQEGGIWHIQEGRWRHYGVEDGLPANRVQTLVAWPDAAGRPGVLAGTTEGVAVWDGQRWHRSPANASLPHPWVWKLRRLARPGAPEELWAATQKGLARWHQDRWLPLSPQPPSLEVNDLILDPDSGDILASLWNQGVARWDGRGWTFPGGREAFPGTRPTALALTRGSGGERVLWAATYDRGLALYQDGAWRELQVDQGLGTPGALSLLEDPGGGRPFLWVGTRGGGVTSLSLVGAARTLSPLPKGMDPDIRAFAEARGFGDQRVLWLGTRAGAFHHDGRAWQGVVEGLPSRELHALASDAAGNLWAGTARGVARLPAGTRRFIPLGGLSQAATALVVDGEEVWAGTPDGLRHWVKGVWRTESEGPGQAPIRALALTRGPGDAWSLWVGTRRQGLWEKTEAGWRRHDPNPNFPNGEVSCLGVTPAPGGGQALWVGYLGNGLARLDLERRRNGWHRFSTRNPLPLPDNLVRALARDATGDLYIAQTVGLSRLRLDASGTELAEVEPLGVPEGLPVQAAHPGAGFTDQTGQVWFGFPQGAAVVEPGGFRPPAAPPSPLLQTTLVEGRPFLLRPDSRLSHRETRLVFEFFVPAFFKEDELQFRSQLVGLEERPTPWGLENRREFQDLGPGRYTLQVWTRDGRGHESPPLTLPFSVRPAPWRHPLALVAYGLAALLGLMGFIRLRTRLLQARNLELEAAVGRATSDLRAANQELSRLNEEKNQFLGIAAHDLKNPLNGILLAMDILDEEEDEGEARSLRAKVRQAAANMVALIGRLLNLSALESSARPFHFERVDLECLVLQLAEEFAPQARTKGHAFHLDIQAHRIEAWSDEATLMEVLQNLVSNALKFMPKGPPERAVTLRVLATEEGPAVEVQDEGPGFTAEDRARAFGAFTRLSAQPTGGEPSSGLGLSIVKRFVDALGGTVSLESEPGRGATFRITLPRTP